MDFSFSAIFLFGKSSLILFAEMKDDGSKEYVLIHNGQWEYASQKYEDIGAYIDIMFL